MNWFFKKPIQFKKCAKAMNCPLQVNKFKMPGAYKKALILTNRRKQNKAKHNILFFLKIITYFQVWKDLALMDFVIMQAWVQV